MKKPYNFQEYELVSDNKHNNIYKVVLILMIIVITIIISKFKFFIYQENILLNDNNKYLVMADINMINTLSTSKRIIINNQKYDFKIKDVGDYTNMNGTIYQSVFLSIKNYKSKVKMTKCYFLKSKNTLLDSIIKFTTGG